MNFGLIADGNRRWAKSQKRNTQEGHQKGVEVIKKEIIPVLKKSLEFHHFTIYAFSTENWKRAPLAVKHLMDLYKKTLSEWLPDLIEQEIKVVHVGRKDRIPSALKKQLETVETETQNYSTFTIYLCIDYGGKDEIIRASQKGTIKDHLEVPDLDLILRTGGEQRLSNFCIWQAAYAELFFLDKYLPEIKKKDIETILAKFKQRDKREGQ